MNSIERLEYKLKKAINFLEYIKTIQGEIIPGRNEPFIPAFWLQQEADKLFEELTKIDSL